jgi:hypothetical protein
MKRFGKTLHVRFGQRALLAATITVLSGGAFAHFFQDTNLTCKSNLKQYALGLLMYQQDYDEMLPPMAKPEQVQNRVMPYIKNRTIVTCPETGSAYLPNPALNYQRQASIAAPATTMMLRDAKAHSDEGKSFWNVAYADGHVSQVPKEPKLGKLAAMPKPPSRLEMIRNQLARMRMSRTQIDGQIKRLEAEERRLRRR